MCGATQGIGRAAALEFARAGARVVLVGRNEDGLAKVLDELKAVSVAAHETVKADFSDLAGTERIAHETARRLGAVHILVNNTGGPPPTPVSGQPASLWAQQFNAMVLSVIALTDRVLPGMKARKFGRILTSASSGVIAPIPHLGLSNALRSSLVGWSKTLAREVARDGITANVIVPGRIATDRIAFLDARKAEREGKTVAEVEAESLAAIPAGRYGRPEEYGDLAAFLASPRAGYITGSVLRMDGGLIANV